MKTQLKTLKLTDRNRHRVPKFQWNKWRPEARVVFNETYATMRDNKECFLHPTLCGIGLFSAKQWDTTCWNAAWIAADAARDAAA